MSRSHDGHWPFFPFGNPFKLILPKRSYMSPELCTLLDSFEKTLAERFRKLKPKEKSHVLSLSWAADAMQCLSETHADIKLLITELQFPVSDWDEKWVEMYLENSVMLLDICIAFSSRLSQLNQGSLFLQYALHVLETSSGLPPQQRLDQAHGSLHDWMQQINCRTPRLEKSSSIIQELVASLNMSKVKNSSKGKVLMQAMYGVKVQTVFFCSILAMALSGSNNMPLDLQVSDKFQWVKAFEELQLEVSNQLARYNSCGGPLLFKELELVHLCVEKFLGLDTSKSSASQENSTEMDSTEILQDNISELTKGSKVLGHGLEQLSKQVDDFFQIVLSGRDALLCSLRPVHDEQEVSMEDNKL